MKTHHTLKTGVVLAVLLLLAGCATAEAPAPGRGVITAGDATALAAERQPTLDAQFTQFAQEFGGTLPSQDPAAAATLSTPLSEEDFNASVGGAEGADPAEEATAPTASPAPPDETAPAPADTAPPAATPTPERVEAEGGVPGGDVLPPATAAGDIAEARDGGDGWPTSLVASMSIGDTVSETLPTDVEAHNWNFDGEAGQTIVIRVEAQGGSDPRVKLIGPQGAFLVVRDTGGDGEGETITLELTQSGLYTVRIDMWTPGGYTLSLALEG